MSKFINFKEAVQQQFNTMHPHGLYIADTTKDKIWDTYLASFPEGSNPIYRERTEHDCNCCKQFIRQVGNVVTMVDGVLTSVWDIEIGGDFQVVADALSSYVKSKSIRNVYFNESPRVGTNNSPDVLEDGTVQLWEHFFLTVPKEYVMRKDAIATHCSTIRSGRDVTRRGLEEITDDAIDTVIELIGQNSLYRGEEHLPVVQKFKKLKSDYAKLSSEIEKDIFCWENYRGSIRNSVIGTLLVDISGDVDLNSAVGAFEAKVAPANYKRSKSLVTKAMISRAEAKVAELGIEDSLPRRFAKIDDITINNVLFADRSAKKAMNVFDEMKKDAPTKSANFDKVEEISIKDFIENIVPKAESLEVFVDNKHANNFVSLIAPEVAGSKNILTWGNNFSWSYRGEVTDSIKERVKRAGGNVTGDLRFSLSWYNYDDLDIHVIEPDGTEIYFGSKLSHATGGTLDVDMNAGGGNSRSAVENVTWNDKARLHNGKYKVFVHNFSKRETCDVGFEVEMEYMGTVKNFSYEKAVGDNERVTVVEFEYNDAKGVKILNGLTPSTASKEIWGVNTQGFRKVQVLMNSPNHWDGEKTGNKHWFFMLDDCVNEESARGFYNEFLDRELHEHRKVFEVLGSKMRVAPSDEQLSGIGFSSTQKSELICKVSGTFNRTVKIIF